jgi:hypothetical protein
MRSPYQLSNDPDGFNTLNHLKSERSFSGKQVPVEQPQTTKQENIEEMAKEKSAKKEVKKPKKATAKKKK